MNLLSNYSVDLSLFEKCYPNIIFGKINNRIHLLPSYVREVWDYSSANNKNIKRSVRNFDWEKGFGNLSVNRKIGFLKETLLNNFRNYIPNKKLKFNYCQPPWMNANIKIIKVIQIYSESIALPLKLLFETALKEKKFPDIWKLANVVPVHKKEEKNLLKNYRPISLLPIFSKIFERVIYNPLFNHFVSNKLFTPAQSGFLPGDSCIAQMLSIIHEIKTSFDSNPPVDVRGVFLDISKSFDRVWHKGLLYKLKSYGVEGELQSLLECYLRDRK